MGSDTVRVLLVESNPGDTRLAQVALGEMPGITAEIVTVAQVEETIAALDAAAFDLVLLDLSASGPSGPGRSGIDRLLELRALTPDLPSLPVIVLTGPEDVALALTAMEAGAQDYLDTSRLDGPTLARAVRYARERHRLVTELEQLVVVDELTGIGNRRGFIALAEHHFALTNRSGGTLSMLYIDVDHMKTINDEHGHERGDHALQTTAALLTRTFRLTDVIGRLGGDEFCVLLTPGGLSGDPRAAVNRLDYALALLNADSSLAYDLTLSIGIAEYDSASPCSLDELISRADQAMYQRKQSRRTRR